VLCLFIDSFIITPKQPIITKHTHTRTKVLQSITLKYRNKKHKLATAIQ